jgi:hypothetical protein
MLDQTAGLEYPSSFAPWPYPLLCLAWRPASWRRTRRGARRSYRARRRLKRIPKAAPADPERPRTPGRLSWPTLLHRVFAVEVLVWPRCVRPAPDRGRRHRTPTRGGASSPHSGGRRATPAAGRRRETPPLISLVPCRGCCAGAPWSARGSVGAGSRSARRQPQWLGPLRVPPRARYTPNTPETRCRDDARRRPEEREDRKVLWTAHVRATAASSARATCAS